MLVQGAVSFYIKKLRLLLNNIYDIMIYIYWIMIQIFHVLCKPLAGDQHPVVSKESSPKALKSNDY